MKPENSKLKITNIASLVDAIQQGHKIKYIYFWGHTHTGKTISHHCLSQWYPRGFQLDNINYPTAEHYLMAQKALLFNDNEIFEKIVQSNHPNAAKRLGREVKNFNESIWDEHKFGIAIKANLEKFTQNPDLKDYLVNTANRVLVEASPVDKIWGVGLAKEDPKILDPNNWPGLNLLGFALMQVRDEIAKTTTQ